MKRCGALYSERNLKVGIARIKISRTEEYNISAYSPPIEMLGVAGLTNDFFLVPFSSFLYTSFPIKNALKTFLKN